MSKLTKFVPSHSWSQLRSFIESDWDGFQGAESFDGSDQPLIAEYGDNWVLVGDADGIQLFNLPDGKSWSLACPTDTQGSQAHLMMVMLNTVHPACLITNFGFEAI